MKKIFSGTASLLITKRVTIPVYLEVEPIDQVDGDVYDDELAEALRSKLKVMFPPVRETEDEDEWSWSTMIAGTETWIDMDGDDLNEVSPEELLALSEDVGPVAIPEAT